MAPYIKMEIGTHVIADGEAGIIVDKYRKNGSFDWEVAFCHVAPNNCWLDCYKSESLNSQ